MSMDTDRIEQDVRDSRHRLNDTLDALGSKLSPGQLLDEALGLAQGQAGQFTANLGRQVRDNPLPVILMATGAALLFMKKNRPSGYSNGAFDNSASLIEDARASTQRFDDETDEAYEDRLHMAYAKALKVKQNAGEAIEDFKSRVAGMVSGAKHAAVGAGDRVAHAVSGAAHAVGGAAHMARDQAAALSEGVASTKHKAQDFYEDTPLAAGAIAMAIGALLGGAAPLSDMERDSLGNVAGKAARATGDLASKGARKAEQVLTTAVH